MKVTKKNAFAVYIALKESFGVDEFFVFAGEEVIAKKQQELRFLKYGHGIFGIVKFTWLKDASEGQKTCPGSHGQESLGFWAKHLKLSYEKVYAEFCRAVLRTMKKHGPLFIGEQTTVSYEQFMIEFELSCSSRKKPRKLSNLKTIDIIQFVN